MNTEETTASNPDAVSFWTRSGSSPPSLPEAARWYAEQGYSIFPCVPLDKTPLTSNGVKAATTDLDTVERWWRDTPDANIGLATGDRFTVLDVDIKPWKDKRGDVSLAALEAQNGKLPTTLYQRTWSGGRQFFFDAESGVKNSASKLGKDLDIRGEGGYVIAPPSVVTEGERSGTYVWAKRSLLDGMKTAPLPPWIVEALALKPTEPVNPPGWEVELLASGSPNGEREKDMTRLIGYLVRELRDDALVAVFMDDWARKSQFPSDPSGNLESDFAKIREKIPRIRAKENAKAAADAATSGEMPTWTLVDAADDWIVPEIEFIVEDLYPRRGVVWVGGTPKAGKSLFVLYSLLCVSKNRETVAEKFGIRRQPKILYIAREDSLARIKGRQMDMLDAWDGERPEKGRLQFLAKQAVDLLKPAHVAELVTICKRDRIDVIVLDTWTALSPGADPLSPKDQAGLAEVVKQLQADIDGCVIVVDHTRKNRPEGTTLSAADIYGPGQKWAAAEHTIMIAGTEADYRHEMFVEGKDGDTLRFFVQRSQRFSMAEKYSYAGSTDNVGERSKSVGTGNRAAVADVVKANGFWITPLEVKAALSKAGFEMSLVTVRRHLRDLSDPKMASNPLRLERLGTAKDSRYRWPSASAQAPSDRSDAGVDND